MKQSFLIEMELEDFLLSVFIDSFDFVFINFDYAFHSFVK